MSLPDTSPGESLFPSWNAGIAVDPGGEKEVASEDDDDDEDLMLQQYLSIYIISLKIKKILVDRNDLDDAQSNEDKALEQDDQAPS